MKRWTKKVLAGILMAGIMITMMPGFSVEAAVQTVNETSVRQKQHSAEKTEVIGLHTSKWAVPVKEMTQDYVHVGVRINAQTGWKQSGGHWYFYDANGNKKTGWLKDNGIWYFMGGDGVMRTGWEKVDGKWYYFASSGAMKTGWQKIDNVWYYLNSFMKTGWQKIDGLWYYLNNYMRTGWQKIDGNWYYFNSEMKTGWLKINTTWFYMGSDGAMRTGWVKVSGSWFYMNSDGSMRTGWLRENGKRYYLRSDGSMAVSTTMTIDGITYTFDANGVARTGGADGPSGNVELQDFTCLAADVFITYFDASESMEEFYAWKEFRALQEERGVNLKMEWVMYDMYNTTLQTRFGSMNNIPYFVSGYDYPETGVMALADNGIILDINDILPYSDGTAADFFANNENGQLAMKKSTTTDGHMYWLPNIYISVFDGQTGVGTNCGVTIRHDWLQAQRLSMPTTTEQFKSVLQKFNQVYGRGVAGDAVYSYRANNLNDGIAQWFGLVRGLLNVDWAAGKAQSPWLQEGFTSYIEYIHDLYMNGLYDPEMITSNDTLRTKVSNNKVGAYTAYALSTTYEPLIEAARDSYGNVTACYVGVYPINAIPGVHALLGLEDPVYMWEEYFFTNQCTNPELAAAFLDAYYCDEHLDLINYGVEGKNYTVVNGEKQWMTYTSVWGGEYQADQLNQCLQDKADERISYGKILYIRGGFPDYTYYRLDDASRNCTNVLGWAAPKDQYQQNTLDFGYWTSLDVEGTLAVATTQEIAAYNEYYWDIETASEEFLNKLIVEGNISDIPGYTSTLINLGLQDLVNIYQARYDRFTK